MLSESLPNGEPAEFRFDQDSRTSHSEQPVPLGGVPRALREAAEMSGLDPLAELYNEALRYAAEGHLRLARERLQMLLCMAPDDGEARLMLAKVQVAGQRWQEALAALDEAQSNGQPTPPALRRAVEDHLAAEEAAKEEQRAALHAREQGEIKALRQEARRLRSENAYLVGRTAELERDTRRWAWTTGGVSTLAILFIAANLLFGRSTPVETTAAPEVVPTPAVAEAPAPPASVPTTEPPPQAAPAPPSPTTTANLAAAALAAESGLNGTSLEVQVTDTRANLTGSVISSRQRRLAEQVLLGLQGVDGVDVSQVVVTARTIGTQHTVVQGDSLSRIALDYYGQSTLTQPIMKANKKTLRGRTNLSIGQVLVIPKVD